MTKVLGYTESMYYVDLIKPKRRRFNQYTIFEYFGVACKKCRKEGKTARKGLTAHHKNGNLSDWSLKNLEILCVYHHRKHEGILERKEISGYKEVGRGNAKNSCGRTLDDLKD